ncbi:MAG TPA: hypothetical protein VJ302_30520 [Blastocatellia bacterium]|nr:hypothetical protein [Blastocatellia bacterium]
MIKSLFAAALLTIVLCATTVDTQTSTPVLTANQRIAALSAASACAKHQWKRQGRAPIGYIKGMTATYARVYCESRRSAETAVSIMKQPTRGNAQDALVWYGKDGPTDADRLRILFTLGIGLGMRESTGNLTEGPDRAATGLTAISAHAGLFQTSYDSLKTSPWLARLYEYYRAHPEACHRDLYQEGVPDKKRPVVGTGPAAEFQRFTKACPAFAAEYAMVVLRVNRKQFGPMNGKRDVEYVQACHDLLRQVESEAGCTP